MKTLGLAPPEAAVAQIARQPPSYAQGADVTGLDGGNVPTWVGIAFMSTSVMLAALSYQRSVRDKERDQASRISAWLSVEKAPEAKFGAEGEVVLALSAVIRVSNRSESPAFEIQLVVPPVQIFGRASPQQHGPSWPRSRREVTPAGLARRATTASPMPPIGGASQAGFRNAF